MNLNESSTPRPPWKCIQYSSFCLFYVLLCEHSLALVHTLWCTKWTDSLRSICKNYYQKICDLEGVKYDVEYMVKKKDIEVRIECALYTYSVSFFVLFTKLFQAQIFASINLHHIDIWHTYTWKQHFLKTKMTSCYTWIILISLASFFTVYSFLKDFSVL